MGEALRKLTLAEGGVLLGVVGFVCGVNCLEGVAGFLDGERRVADPGVPGVVDAAVELRRDGRERTLARVGLPSSDATAATCERGDFAVDLAGEGLTVSWKGELPSCPESDSSSIRAFAWLLSVVWRAGGKIPPTAPVISMSMPPSDSLSWSKSMRSDLEGDEPCCSTVSVFF